MQELLDRAVLMYLDAWKYKGPEPMRNLTRGNWMSLLKRLNIVLSRVTSDRVERLAIVSEIFHRPIFSTKDLTLAEVKAFLVVSEYPDVDPAFLDWLIYLKETVYDIQKA